jgi:hypothetical protein
VGDLPRIRCFPQTERCTNQVLEHLAVGKDAAALDEAVGKRNIAADRYRQILQVELRLASGIWLPIIPALSIRCSALVLHWSEHVVNQHIGKMVCQEVVPLPLSGRGRPLL